MKTTSREELDQLRRSPPAATNEGVTERYRTSQHSWYKLGDGKPVKQTLIDRIRPRYDAMVDHMTAAGPVAERFYSDGADTRRVV